MFTAVLHSIGGTSAAFEAKINHLFSVTRKHRSVTTPARRTAVGGLVVPHNEMHVTS